MIWPWSKPERRESAPYTDSVVDAIVSASSGSPVSSIAATAALEVAVGLISRILSAGVVEGPEWARRMVSSEMLRLVARDLIRRGESIHLIESTGGGVQLVPVGSWDVRGGWLPESWFYRCDLFGPSGNITRFVPSDSVTHFRYSVDPARPWFGISPLGWSRTTGRLHAELEAALADEAATTRGQLLPLPVDPAAPDDDGETDPLAGLKTTIKNLRGKLAVLETTAGNWGGDRQDRPREDYKPKRIGADPPEVLAELRQDSAIAVLAACGVPASLLDPKAPGTTLREGWRQMYAGTIQPMARTIEAELSEKLEVEIRITFDEPAHADLVGRATIAARLAGIEGINADRALELAGLS